MICLSLCMPEVPCFLSPADKSGKEGQHRGEGKGRVSLGGSPEWRDREEVQYV